MTEPAIEALDEAADALERAKEHVRGDSLLAVHQSLTIVENVRERENGDAETSLGRFG